MTLTAEKLKVKDGFLKPPAGAKFKIPASLANNELCVIDELAYHPKNSKIGDVKAIAESMDEHGQYVPILVSVEGTIIKGNHTHKAAVENEWTHIVVIRSDYDYDKSIQILEADNRLSELGTFDKAQRAENLKYLMESGLLRGTGFDADSVDSLIASMGEIDVTDDEEFEGGFVEDPDDTAQRYPGGRSGTGSPDVAMRELMLMYPVEDFEIFKERVRELGKKWGVEAVRDIVRECVNREFAKEFDAEQEFDDDE